MPKACEAKDYTTLKPAEIALPDRLPLMGAVIGPRPVVVITTVGSNGIVNAGAYSNYMGVSSEPVLVCFALGRRNGEEKDTLRNIKANSEFVVNNASSVMAEGVHKTAVDFPPERSEIPFAGFHTIPSEIVHAQRIAESPIQLECRLHQLVELGEPEPTNTIVIGEVVRIHVRKDLITADGKVRGEGWDALGGIGDAYVTMGEVFELPYPEVPAE